MVLRTTSSRGRGRALTPSGSQQVKFSNQGLASAVSEKLRGFQELRELMEALAVRHKKEEVELQSIMKRILTNETKHTASPPVGSNSAVSNSLAPAEEIASSMRAEVRQITEERDRAIAMLCLFREEGNAVMQRMHQSLRQAHEQHEAVVAKLDKTAMENARLRYIVREVRFHASQQLTELHSADDLDAVTSATKDCAQDSDDDSDKHLLLRERLSFAKHTISKLDDLLQEADAVIVNLRAHNEELLRQNESLRQRERARHPEDASDAGSDFASDAATVETRDGESVSAYIERLKNNLRLEKRQRLEAEELSHKLLVEHQKNVLLLEQRLLQRQPVGTPRGATPQKYSTRQSTQPILMMHSASHDCLPSPASVNESNGSGAAPAAPATDLTEELGIFLRTDNPPESLHRPGVAHDKPEKSLSLQQSSEPRSDEDHEQHLSELRSIEEQLKEVVASLEDV